MQNILLISAAGEAISALLPDYAVTAVRSAGEAEALLRCEHDFSEAEQLIARMQQTASSYAIKDVTLSVSLGYCTMADDKESIADSIKRSDADMYRDKQRKKAQRV